MKRLFLPVILIIFVSLASGCTIVRAVGGLGKGAAEGATEGFKQDVAGFVKFDNWLKSKLW